MKKFIFAVLVGLMIIGGGVDNHIASDELQPEPYTTKSIEVGIL